jgi:catechol 2,3-dioxygenase-like lactoylglutathione lyase family enzyme
VSGLNHVEINVSDLQRSIEFWGWLLPQLGFEPYQTWQEGQSYRCDDVYLVFVQAEERFRERQYHRKGPGLNHLALWARSRDQVRAFPELLRERGVRVLYGDRAPGGIGAPSEWSVFFEDPDRIKVEIVAPDE